MANDLEMQGSVGLATFPAGRFGQGLGLSNAVATQPPQSYAVANFADFVAGADWTIEGWVYASSATNIRVFGWGTPTANISTFQVADHTGSPASGVPRSFTGFNGANIYGSQIASASPAWYHWALVQEGSTTALYWDGTRAGTASGAYSPRAGEQLYVGCFAASLNGPPNGLFLDELAIWNYARYSGASYAVPAAPFVDNSPGIVALYHFDGTLADSAIPPQATSISLAGPPIVATGSPSAPYTVALAPAPASTVVPVTVTPHDGGAGGTFAPTSVQVTTAAPAATFTYTAAATGTVTLSVTNDALAPDLDNPAPLAVTVVSGASRYTLAGPASGAVGLAAGPFTASLPAGTGTNAAVTVVPSDNVGGGAFSPTALTLGAGTTSATCTYTPGSGGAKTITATNNGALDDAAPLSFTAQSGAATAVALTGPASGAAGQESAPFTVSLVPVGASVSAAVTVIPSDGAAGGTFSPAQVSLTTAAPAATFTYTPPAGSTTVLRAIGLTTGGGLVTASVIYTVLGATSYVKLFAVQYGPAYSGLAEEIGYTVYGASGNVLVAHTAGQTSEMGTTGIYSASVALDQAWNGVVVFDAPAEGVAPAAAEFDILLPSAPALIAL